MFAGGGLRAGLGRRPQGQVRDPQVADLFGGGSIEFVHRWDARHRMGFSRNPRGS